MRRHAGFVIAPLIAIVALLSGSVPPSAAAAERAVVLDAAASTVTFTLGTTFHEVHGTMALAGGAIRFDPSTGVATGTITVDARHAETGNDKRDKTMHADVLESERYPEVVFRAERVEGTLVDPGHSDLRLVGVMKLHGADHPMTLTASIDSADGKVRGELKFPIPYVEWGMHDPSFFVARAEKTVNVTVRIEARWSDAVAATR